MHADVPRPDGQANAVEERRDLVAALRLVQGGVLARRPAGRYAWLARVRLERAARDLLVDAAHRLAVLSTHDDDPTAARAAAWAGLGVAPTDELLWRDVLRAAYAEGGADAVRSAAAEMEMTLQAAGSPRSALRRRRCSRSWRRAASREQLPGSA